MPTKRAPQAPRSRTWRISIFKKRLEYVDRVQAMDRASAETVAASEFELKDHERTRLLIEEVRGLPPPGSQKQRASFSAVPFAPSPKHASIWPCYLPTNLVGGGGAALYIDDRRKRPHFCAVKGVAHGDVVTHAKP